MPTALVTGATGQVGMHVVKRLLRDGWEVRALVRDAARAGSLSRMGVTLATGDTLEPTGFARAARGCEVVYHAAAAITPRGGWEAFSRPNVEGTRTAIAAAAGASARLVHVSSVAVYGGSSRYEGAPGTITEDAPQAPLAPDSWYARSKRESEALVLEAHAAGRLWATAVRPCVIYGPHDRQLVPRVGRLLGFGFAPLVGGGHTKMSLVHAANVADGMVRAAATEAAGGRAYNLTNDHDVTVEEFFRWAGEGMGRKLRMVRIPYMVARMGLSVATAIAPIVFGNQFRELSAASLDFVSHDNPFNSDRARRELGWDPPVRHDTGVREAFAWWAQHR